jgi:predicted DNA binding CopG/RHH family protein
MKKAPRGKFDIEKMRTLGQEALSAEDHTEALRQIAIADEEFRVNFRWGHTQVNLVKQVADLMGVSYQQYIKQVVFRQAQSDLEQFSKTVKPASTELTTAI